MINTKAKIRPSYSALGKKIKKKLIDKGLTAAELAHVLGMTPQYLNDIMHGRRSGKKYMEQIKKLLDIDTDTAA